jgi:hypothetical protein
MLKKLVSENPTVLKPISLAKASREYLAYVAHHFNQKYYGGKERVDLLNKGKFNFAVEIKDFKRWLRSEI